jgi:hypothetical protein
MRERGLYHGLKVVAKSGKHHTKRERERDRNSEKKAGRGSVFTDEGGVEEQGRVGGAFVKLDDEGAPVAAERERKEHAAHGEEEHRKEGLGHVVHCAQKRRLACARPRETKKQRL